METYVFRQNRTSVANGLGKSEDVMDNCDIKSKLLNGHDSSPPTSPTNNVFWFKTWPECCDKAKLENGLAESNMPEKGSFNRLTLNEALKTISLAYSPVTKQLHYLPSRCETEESDSVRNNCNVESPRLDEDEESEKKPRHRRTQAESISSTVSSLSDPSPSGSLLGADEGYLSVDDSKQKKHIIAEFFSRNVFSRNFQSSSGANGITAWKLFSKPIHSPVNGSPQHYENIVASSTALIQNLRPSNLPAKTAEEEQRHSKEYKMMVKAAKKKEAQSTAAKQKQQKVQLQQEEQMATSAKYFASLVLPNWENMCRNRKTKDLWWQGLPSNVRGRVWRLAIGNELNITQQLYSICLQRAQTRLNSPDHINNESDKDQESSMDVIQLDISRTFPHLCIFQEGGPYSSVLHSLLASFVCYRPDVGYVQGMSYIAAILILNMDELDAFVCFANLLNRPLHLAAFTLNQLQMQAYYNVYNELFCYNLPKLHLHFQNSGLTPDLYLLDWIYTIFAKAMPLDVACRIWDVFLRDGDEFLFRTALGVLHLNQDRLMHMDFLHGAQFLTRLPEDLSADHLFKSIHTVSTKVGRVSFSQLVERFRLSVVAL